MRELAFVIRRLLETLFERLIGEHHLQLRRIVFRRIDFAFAVVAAERNLDADQLDRCIGMPIGRSCLCLAPTPRVTRTTKRIPTRPSRSRRCRAVVSVWPSSLSTPTWPPRRSGRSHGGRLPQSGGRGTLGAVRLVLSIGSHQSILDAVEPVNEIGRQRVDIARELAHDIDRLDDQLKASKRRITSAVTASGTSLTQISGVGPICAGRPLEPFLRHYATIHLQDNQFTLKLPVCYRQVADRRYFNKNTRRPNPYRSRRRTKRRLSRRVRLRDRGGRGRPAQLRGVHAHRVGGGLVDADVIPPQIVDQNQYDVGVTLGIVIGSQRDAEGFQIPIGRLGTSPAQRSRIMSAAGMGRCFWAFSRMRV